MKRIKLFENFNELNSKEIVADIETIIYELEEKEYDVEIFYKTILGDSLIKTSQYENHGDEYGSKKRVGYKTNSFLFNT